jgi:multicomponent Na+:H+ antiporter subunit B
MRMSKLVRIGADLIYPFALIFGLYIILHGHLTPGGGFQGGAVVATGVAIVIVAWAYDDVAGMIRKLTLQAQESGGLLLFIGAAALALGLGYAFFYNALANSGLLFGLPVPFGPNPGELNTAGIIPLMNIAVGIEVWGGLTVILLYLLSGLKKQEGS